MYVCVKKLKQEIRRAKLTTRKPRKALPKWNEMSCHYGLRWRVNSKQHFARLPLSSLFVVVGCYICCSYAVPIFSLFSFCCFFLLLYSFFFQLYFLDFIIIAFPQASSKNLIGIQLNPHSWISNTKSVFTYFSFKLWGVQGSAENCDKNSNLQRRSLCTDAAPVQCLLLSSQVLSIRRNASK